jgi:hypothetical protein
MNNQKETMADLTCEIVGYVVTPILLEELKKKMKE